MCRYNEYLEGPPAEVQNGLRADVKQGCKEVKSEMRSRFDIYVLLISSDNRACEALYATEKEWHGLLTCNAFQAAPAQLRAHHIEGRGGGGGGDADLALETTISK